MRREVVDGKSALAEALTTVEQKNVALSEAEKVKNELREFLEAAEMRHLDFIGLRDAALKEVAAAFGEPTARYACTRSTSSPIYKLWSKAFIV